MPPIKLCSVSDLPEQEHPSDSFINPRYAGYSMVFIPERGDSLVYDSLTFLGIVLISFGIGTELDRWLANDAYLAPLLYIVILFVVYVKWILPQHK